MPSVYMMRLVAGALLVSAAPAHAERVGTAGAVNTRSVSTQPGGAERVMEIGAQVVRNERIETSSSGSMQITFIDKTSLTIGPNSKLTIDEFVYNPADGTGTMSVRLGRGLLRVVGGQVTHTGGATITTPAATIGVRGGVATVNHCTGQCDQPGTRATLHFGSLTVTPIGPGGSPTGAPQSITRPGFATFVAGQGQGGQANTASAPQRATQSEVGETNTALNSKPGQAGGATSKPTDQGAGNAGVGNVPGDAGQIASRQGQNASGVTASVQTLANRSSQNSQQVAQQGAQGAAAQVTAGALMSASTSSPKLTGPVQALANPRADKAYVGYSAGIVNIRQGEGLGRDYAVTGRVFLVAPTSLGGAGAKLEFPTGVTGSDSPKVVMLNLGTAPSIDTTRAYPPNGSIDLSKVAITTGANGSDTSRSLYSDAGSFGALTQPSVAGSSTTETSGFYNDVSKFFSAIGGTTPVTPFDRVDARLATADAVSFISTAVNAKANSTAFLSSLSDTTVKPCDCEYTRWGFWTANAIGSDPTTGNTFVVQSPLNTWVAGVPSRLTDLPTTGTATYAGHAIATISNDGTTYLASGNFSNAVDFGRYRGVVSITNLDKTNYSGTVYFTPSSTLFAGSLTGSTVGRSAALQGMFYQGGPTNLVPKVGEMGGTININGGSAYTGSGTFAAKLISATGVPR